MIFACPLLLLKHCANILLDRELGPIPVYTLRRCLPSSRAFKMHLCAFYSPVFGDWSCTWYSYWVMVLYKNRKIFFSFDFILQIAHSQSFYFIFFVCVPIATYWPCLSEESMASCSGLFSDIIEFTTFYVDLRFLFQRHAILNTLLQKYICLFSADLNGFSKLICSKSPSIS